jgi:AcrR family transcriptional regulator
MPDSAAHPHGREAVESALIEASIELFATRTPDQVTVREIADHAAVNHGLVHQYFGSKRSLVERTIQHLAGELLPAATGAVDVASAMPDLLDRLVERRAYVRLITWSLLSEDGLPDLGHDFPALRRMVDRTGAERDGATTRIDPRIAASVVTALMFGWVMYRDYIDAAVDLSDLGQVEIHDGISRSIAAMMSWNRHPNERRRAA